MTPGKRAMDLALALFLSVVLVLPMMLIAVMILMIDGRPVFYTSQRMKSPTVPFRLWKFRTMRPRVEDHTVSAGYKNQSITRTGRFLRRTRLDELPQLLNILRGDMSFVGPRPPLPRYVQLFPEIYGAVLQKRPGVTGLATLRFHRREEQLLAQCMTAEETDTTYRRRCIPAKARLDLIWAQNHSLCFDLKLILETVKKVFGLGRRS
ncbi:sugar transferase [Roseovarius aestuariivivens]|uniref:sugar transferase n=1 Tax=Roseovarius aestuariivivens TaxID=1888910 RepID=UPI0010812345|nr:sugar transferase [Roseovarius aestuariivivens]